MYQKRSLIVKQKKANTKPWIIGQMTLNPRKGEYYITQIDQPKITADNVKQISIHVGQIL